MLVNQQSHQLRNGNCWMGVVELHRETFVETIWLTAEESMQAEHVLQGTRNKEKLLLQAQSLALRRFVIRIKDLGDVFGLDFCFDRAEVIALVERGEIEGFHCLGFPETQRV